MKIRYTLRAARQVEKVLDYVASQSPQGAADVQTRILAITTLLQQYPAAGRATTRPGVRRIVLAPYPYVIDYRVGADEIIVQRFRHSARKPTG